MTSEDVQDDENYIYLGLIGFLKNVQECQVVQPPSKKATLHPEYA